MTMTYLRTKAAALSPGFRQLLGGSAWLAITAALGQGSMLAAGIAVANTLGVQNYGRFTLMQTTLLLLAGLAQLSFSVVISQQVSKYRDSDPRAAGRIAGLCFALTLAMGAVLAGALFAGRHLLAEQAFRDASLVRDIAIVAAIVPIVAIAAVQQGLFNGLARFREQALVAAALVPVVIGLPYLGALEGGLEAALAGLAGAFGARFLLAQSMLFYVFRKEGLRWEIDRSATAIARLFDLAGPATLAGMAVLLAVWGGQTLLARQPGSDAALGLFNASYMIRTVVIFLPQQAVLALLPLVTRSSASDSVAGGANLLRTTAIFVIALTVPVAALATIFAESILRLYGPPFADGRMTLVILLLSAPLEALTITLYQKLQSQGRFWRGLTWVNAPLAVTVLVSASLLVPDYLSQGLATAWLIGWSLALVLTHLATRSQEEFR